MLDSKTFITVDEVGEVLCVKRAKAYNIVRDLNKELEEKGFLIIPGRVSRKYFEERFYGVAPDEEKEEAHASK